MGFQELFQIGTTPAKANKKDPSKQPRKSSPKLDERGCDFCPLNKVKGINKIMGKVEGKELALFAQSPGPDENDEGRELVGRAGSWLWEELSKVGLEREDFDIQNVAVRCFPADVTEGSYRSSFKMRDPSAKEIKCCSFHNDQMFPKLKAKQIIIFGKLAAKAALSTRSLPTQKIFWSEKLNARVYLLDHPSYFVRGYAPADRLKAFRDSLAIFAADCKKGSVALADPFHFIKKQDYRLVLNRAQARKAAEYIRAQGHRVAFDIEDRADGDGRAVICCGFCPKPGHSFVFVFNHKEQDPDDGRAVEAVAKELLEDPKIPKAAQYGCSDTVKLEKYCGIVVQNFDHDTNLSEYLRFSDKKAYGLEAIVEARFPDFSGYAQIVTADMVAALGDKLPAKLQNASTSVQYDYIFKHRLADYGSLSLETLRLYNGADCDVTKRIEVSNKKHVKPALLRLYIDLSYILQEMEPNGPLFDYRQNDALAKIYPVKEKQLLKELRKMLGDKEYNPASSKQVFHAIYKTLKLEYPFADARQAHRRKPNTRKETMLMLTREHPFPGKQLAWRKISKAKSTYVAGYRTCADLNDGRLRTRWWSTGTRSGRLSSGGKREDPGVINLQNIHKDPLMQNMCIADRRWRKVYKAIKRILEPYTAIQDYYAKLDAWKAKGDRNTPKPKPDEATKAQFLRAAQRIENWVRKNIPDLMTFLILDYGQVEVRVMAQLSGDKNLKKDCLESDIHTKVGVTMTGWSAESIRDDDKTRTLTKNVHFGIMFGISKANLYAFVIAMTPPEQQNTISREEVEAAYDRYFARYPGVARFIQTQREFGRSHSYVETLFGMPQELIIREDDDDDGDYITDDDNVRTSYWGNQAINGPVQGTAHQLLECAIVNLRRQREKYKLLGVPVMDVHDALYHRVKVLDLLAAYQKLTYLMEHESLNTVKKDFPDISWDVPIVTEAEAGLRLGTKVDINKDTTVGMFLFDWYWKCREQVIVLNQELAKVSSIN